MRIKIEAYEELVRIRADHTLLDAYRYNPEKPITGQLERLKLAVAIYNNRLETDFPIALYLFEQEVCWRKEEDYDESGYFDHFYFIAYVLALFRKPEIVWLFWDAKHIDMDCGVGFDGEHLVAAGIPETIAYVQQSNHPLKDRILNYINHKQGEYPFTAKRLENWHRATIKYHLLFRYPENNHDAFLLLKRAVIRLLELSEAKENMSFYDHLVHCDIQIAITHAIHFLQHKKAGLFTVFRLKEQVRKISLRKFEGHSNTRFVYFRLKYLVNCANQVIFDRLGKPDSCNCRLRNQLGLQFDTDFKTQLNHLGHFSDDYYSYDVYACRQCNTRWVLDPHNDTDNGPTWHLWDEGSYPMN